MRIPQEARYDSRKAREFSQRCGEQHRLDAIDRENLRKALKEQKRKNKEMRDSFRLTADVLGFRCR